MEDRSLCILRYVSTSKGKNAKTCNSAIGIVSEAIRHRALPTGVTQQALVAPRKEDQVLCNSRSFSITFPSCSVQAIGPKGHPCLQKFLSLIMKFSYCFVNFWLMFNLLPQDLRNCLDLRSPLVLGEKSTTFNPSRPVWSPQSSCCCKLLFFASLSLAVSLLLSSSRAIRVGRGRGCLVVVWLMCWWFARFSGSDFLDIVLLYCMIKQDVQDMGI